MRRSYMANGSNNYQYQDTSQILEDENQRMEDELQGKVKALKHLSINIGEEVREQNKYLRQMLKSITNAGHWKIWLYMALFALFVFFMCWVIIKFR
ncbi:unnamed protein product [Candidula unifasciata]|uniref:t-SNARE coiled-coil homology domain-containing protein n=1 Tax=Candidula unifasciata TaxID=100452 RepID=A0A8S4A0X6_9EUPU|nr:unnamed protein product [Candidula unifasciata]